MSDHPVPVAVEPHGGRGTRPRPLAVEGDEKRLRVGEEGVGVGPAERSRPVPQSSPTAGARDLDVVAIRPIHPPEPPQPIAASAASTHASDVRSRIGSRMARMVSRAGRGCTRTPSGSPRGNSRMLSLTVGSDVTAPPSRIGDLARPGNPSPGFRRAHRAPRLLNAEVGGGGGWRVFEQRGWRGSRSRWAPARPTMLRTRAGASASTAGLGATGCCRRTSGPRIPIFDDTQLHKVALTWRPTDWQSILNDSAERRVAPRDPDLRRRHGRRRGGPGLGRVVALPRQPKMSMRIRFDAFGGHEVRGRRHASS